MEEDATCCGGPPLLPDDQAPQQNKMFVGGLAQTVTSDFLKAYFSNFGPVQDAFVLMDEQSGRSRGFGFVTFDNPQTLKLVLKQKPHVLGNKQVDCKHAVNKNVKRPTPVTKPAPHPPAIATTTFQQKLPTTGPLPAQGTIWPYDVIRQGEEEVVKDDVSPQGNMEWSDNESSDLFLTGGGKSYLALSGDKWLEDCEEADARKIFVGGLPDITPAEFAKYFEHFGPVADAMIMYDRKRRRQRGFGFITFASDEGVRNSLNFSRHPVKGKVVEVKKAHPLVLQNARAPAKQELEAERAAAAAASQRDPFGIAANNGGGFSHQMASALDMGWTKYPDAPWHAR